MFLSSQLSTIVSQPTLGAELLFQGFKSASTYPLSADPQKEPISVETTDASKAAKDLSPSISPPDAAKAFFLKFLIFIQFSPFSDHLPCQTLPKETLMQEQESDNPPIDSDPIGTVIQTIESPVQQTIDGKKVICLAYLSASNLS